MLMGDEERGTILRMAADLVKSPAMSANKAAALVAHASPESLDAANRLLDADTKLGEAGPIARIKLKRTIADTYEELKNTFPISASRMAEAPDETMWKEGDAKNLLRALCATQERDRVPDIILPAALHQR